jgi:cell division protein FtsI (penicillin-binding protein 3)
MAEERGSSRFKLPWTLPTQRIARRESAPAPFDWRQTVHSRLLVFAAIFAFWTVAIEARLLYLQVWNQKAMLNRAAAQQNRIVEPPAKRGEVLDRDGEVIAVSVDAETIAADPAEVVNPEETARLVCAALDDCGREKRQELVKALGKKGRFAFIERQASPEVAARVLALDLPGITTYRESRRYYPNRQLAANLLGYVGIDNKGLAGIEAMFDSRIRGRDGRLQMQIDGLRKTIAVREERQATAGESVELTIDQNLQYIAERELRAGVEEHNAAGGTAIVMDPNSGEILALASYPTFNPNAFGEATSEMRKNRAIQDVYEPGSTFKIVTAAAAIEEGVLRMSDIIDCAPGLIRLPGRARPVYDVHPYGALSFADVIVKSSNVGAIKAGQRIGAERLGRYINRFGFGQRLAPDFRGESAGIVWNPAAIDASGLGSISMGYQISVTPLQMVTAVSSVANGGTLYEPHLVRAFIKNGRREPVPAKPLRQTVSRETSAILTGVMEEVVERGTATSAKIEGYTIAGKTGTAAKIVNGAYSKSDYNTSFVGFLPSRKPALSVIVVIDSPHGKVTAYGGTVAAPIFKRIAEASLRYLGIGPTLNARPPVVLARGTGDDGAGPRRASTNVLLELIETAKDGYMPDLRGLSARDAVRSLSSIGLRAQVSGSGVVVEQFPEPNAALVPGDGARLKLARRPMAVPAGVPQQ